MRPIIDVDAVAAPSFALADDHSPFESPWHRHRRHQLLYAVRGALRLECAGGQWLLPPQRAGWIASGTLHKVTASGPVALRTVYLSRPLGRGIGGACHVFELPDVGREMIVFAMRWGPDTRPRDELARDFFALLATLCAEWAACPDRFRLPAARTPPIERAMALSLDRLGEKLTVGRIARAAGLSSRTLERRFVEETGITWRSFVSQARMLRALERLAAPGTRVTEVAFDLGFSSLGAFTRAFRAFTGEPPRDYRLRARR